MAVEASSAWEPEAAKVLRHLAAAASATSGRDTQSVHRELLQGLSVCVRRDRARAALRRACEPLGGADGAVSAAQAVVVAAAAPA